ncbi:grasp-with-spasm system ATP-grasp peptide maturase [uncultured Aquimarina sp.]|uniref:grasp-with-spasm system ATP-grasp peptide maturase n=1 Tax=uncultured Aquimarina sp. TaxID=575652 RepID=UPI00262C7403|nr:grasp-with-spasm system ATP-grasp peptide maturase [uncultured Aquimarina sp.]
MHLIFSEKIDFSTNRVIDWLYYYDQEYEKFIGPSENKDHFRFTDKTISFTFGGVNKEEKQDIIDDSSALKIDSTWFRRPNHNTRPFNAGLEYNGVYPENILKYTLQQRTDVFWEYLGYTLESNNHLGSFKTFELNKPIVMQEAERLGLTIPKTLITNSKKDLKAFFKSCNNRIITKSLHEIIPEYKHPTEDSNTELSFHQYTTLIDDLKNTPDVFAPSLFQECIDKEYEIRTIFLNGSCYSAAIFSQLNEETKIDMRNRDANTPTRYIPYQLTPAIEESIIKLMDKLRLSYGAIDIMKSIDGHYYFLEINPVGQYGDVSMQCNYYLNKKIAEHLINNN